MPVVLASMQMPNYAFKPYFVKVLLLYELNVQCSELRINMNKQLKQITDIVIEEGTTTWVLMPETSTVQRMLSQHVLPVPNVLDPPPHTTSNLCHDL
jgi:hypothetical protein